MTHFESTITANEINQFFSENHPICLLELMCNLRHFLVVYKESTSSKISISVENEHEKPVARGKWHSALGAECLQVPFLHTSDSLF